MSEDANVQRLERKVDDLSGIIHSLVEKVGHIPRLEERMAGFMALMEQIVGRDKEDIADLKTKYATHDVEIATLKATVAANTASSAMRNRIADGVVVGWVKPVLLGALFFLAAYWINSNKMPQVTMTSAPVINSQRPEKELAR